MRLNSPPETACLGGVEFVPVQRVLELDSGHAPSLSPMLSASSSPRRPSSRAHSASRSPSRRSVMSPIPAPALPVLDSFDSFGDEEEESVLCPEDAVADTEAQMVIVIACMNEKLGVLDGVLRGVPHNCLILLVSNSNRRATLEEADAESDDEGQPESMGKTVDKYEKEVELVRKVCREARRQAITVHQQDPNLAAALKAAGMPELTQEDENAVPRIRAGKGEAMIVGMAIAALTKHKYIGYVDADNFVPGSVTEYCKVFAAGLYAATEGGCHPHAMVRITWNSKPKIRDNKLHFDKKGRSSKVVNRWLNRLLAEHYVPPGDNHDDGSWPCSSPAAVGVASPSSVADLIVTGNAGEHAMTLDLGLKLRLAGGYAIEPYEIINILEQFGPLSPYATPSLPSSRRPQSATPGPVSHIVPTIDTTAASDLSALGVYQSSEEEDGMLSPASAVSNTRPILIPSMPRERSSSSPISPGAKFGNQFNPSMSSQQHISNRHLCAPSPTPSAGSFSSNSSQGSYRSNTSNTSSTSVMSFSSAAAVRVLQIKTGNPHFHDADKGKSHIQRMQRQALSVLYHSHLVPADFKRELAAYMEKESLLPSAEVAAAIATSRQVASSASATATTASHNAPSTSKDMQSLIPKPERIYPPVGDLDFGILYDMLTSPEYNPENSSFKQCGIRRRLGERLVFHPEDDFEQDDDYAVFSEYEEHL